METTNTMKLSIINKKENKLMNRDEISFEIEHVSEATPSRIELRTLLSAKLSVKPELVSVRNINSGYGTSKSIGAAHVYKNEAELKKHEPKHILKRMELKEKKAEPKPAEKAEEKPSEEAPAESEEALKEESTELKGDEEK